MKLNSKTGSCPALKNVNSFESGFKSALKANLEVIKIKVDSNIKVICN